jgi:hypothetical protein
MHRKTKIFSGGFTKKLVAILAIVLVAHYVFAVDGNQGGKKSSKVFSSIKSNLNISLKSMYAMGNQNNFSVKRAPSTSMTHTVITYHKGNQTWVMPYKNNIKILGRFKTPSR